MLATVVDTTALAKTVVYAFVAGVGVTLAFSLAILGAARFTDLSRAGRAGGAAAYMALTLVALAACTAAIVIGIVVMTSK
jgi:hypothetical protein